MINQQSPPIPVPHFDGDRLSETTVLPSDIYRSFKRNLPLSTSSMPDEITKAILCQANCSGNGECRDGSCYCMVRKTFNYMNCRKIHWSKVMLKTWRINYMIFSDPIWRWWLSTIKFFISCGICIYIFSTCPHITHSTCHVHTCRWENINVENNWK